MQRLTAFTLGAAAVWLECGCGGSAQTPAVEATRGTDASAVAPDLAKSCARERPGVGPLPERSAARAGRQGSSVALARRGRDLVAYVADRDRNRLVVADVTAKKMEGAAPLHGAPEQVVVLADGRVVVSIGSGHHLEIFEPTGDRGTPLHRLCAREVPAGPFGLAISPDEGTLVVTSAWDPTLTVLDRELATRGATARQERVTHERGAAGRSTKSPSGSARRRRSSSTPRTASNRSRESSSP